MLIDNYNKKVSCLDCMGHEERRMGQFWCQINGLEATAESTEFTDFAFVFIRFKDSFTAGHNALILE